MRKMANRVDSAVTDPHNRLFGPYELGDRSMYRFITGCLVFWSCCAIAVGQERLEPTATAAQSTLASGEVAGDRAPAPIPLWPGKPPKFIENAPPETVDANGRIRMVSVPAITAYLPPHGKGKGMAIIVCAGGGYGASIGKRTSFTRPITSFPRAWPLSGLNIARGRLIGSPMRVFRRSPCWTPSEPCARSGLEPPSGTSIPARWASSATRQVRIWR